MCGVVGCLGGWGLSICLFPILPHNTSLLARIPNNVLTGQLPRALTTNFVNAVHKGHILFSFNFLLTIVHYILGFMVQCVIGLYGSVCIGVQCAMCCMLDLWLKHKA